MRIEEEDEEEEEEGARTNIITKLSENKKAIQFVVKYIRWMRVSEDLFGRGGNDEGDLCENCGKFKPHLLISIFISKSFEEISWKIKM